MITFPLFLAIVNMLIIVTAVAGYFCSPRPKSREKLGDYIVRTLTVLVFINTVSMSYIHGGLIPALGMAVAMIIVFTTIFNQK